MIHVNRHSLLALLLSTVLVAVQTALPWMHVGCQHDHSAASAAATASAAAKESAHRHCRHHKHVEQPSVDSAAVDGHRHDQALSDDCAACRFMLLSSARSEPSAIALFQEISLLHACPSAADGDCQAVGLYRSRAPPALS